jgi:hypothetical protein
LVPTLRPGDVLVLERLIVHKQPEARIARPRSFDQVTKLLAIGLDSSPELNARITSATAAIVSLYRCEDPFSDSSIARVESVRGTGYGYRLPTHQASSLGAIQWTAGVMDKAGAPSGGRSGVRSIRAVRVALFLCEA